MSNLTIVKDTILSVQDSFVKIAPEEMNFQKEMQFAMQAIESNDFLKKTCFENPESLKNAIINISAIGLTLNPALKIAYLVPRDGKVCLDISYVGLVKLATDSGSIKWVQAFIVRDKDEFVFNGVGVKPTHTFNPFSKERGEVVGVYCVAKTIDDEFLVNVMSIEECYMIRDRTVAWRAYKAGKAKSCPWLTDETEMIKKTIIRRDYKLWPKTDRLSKAVDELNKTDGIDFEKETRDVTPASNEKIDALSELLLKIEGGEPRLIKHINLKYKPSTPLYSIDELNKEQVDYSISFINTMLNATKLKEASNAN